MRDRELEVPTPTRIARIMAVELVTELALLVLASVRFSRGGFIPELCKEKVYRRSI